MGGVKEHPQNLECEVAWCVHGAKVPHRVVDVQSHGLFDYLTRPLGGLSGTRHVRPAVEGRSIRRPDPPDRATKALGNALSIDEKAHNLAAISNPEDRGSRGARDIDGGEYASIQEKATPYAAGISEIAHDLAASIDPGGFGPRGARDIDIDLSELALVQEKAVDDASSVAEPAHDLASSIDPNGGGKRGAWNLDRGEGPCGGGAWLPVGAGEDFASNNHRCHNHQGERAGPRHKRVPQRSAKASGQPVHGVSSF